MKRGLIALGLIALILAVAMVWRYRQSPARQLADARNELSRAVQAEFDETPPEEAGLPLIEVKDVALGDQLDGLEGESAEKLALGLVPDVMQLMNDRYSRILEMPAEQQREVLDRIIEQQQNSPLAEKIRNDPSLGGGQHSRIAVRTQAPDGLRQKVVDSDTDEGARFMLDNTTPEQRAVMEQFVNLLHERMRQRGIDPKDVPIMLGIRIGEEPDGM